MTEAGEEVKPWRWPGQWMRQESFWRDVGSRTLAAAFAAGIVYVFALAAGYVARPNVWRSFLVLGTAAVVITISFWMANWVDRHTSRSKREPVTIETWEQLSTRHRAVVMAKAFGGLICLLGIVAVAIYIGGALVFDWPTP